MRNSEAASANVLYQLYFDSGHLYYTHESGSGADTALDFGAIGDLGIDTGEWAHIALVRDAAAKSVTLYVDGVQAGSTLVYTADPSDGGASELLLGLTASSNEYFNGALADVRVWDRTLTAALAPSRHRWISNRLPICRA